MRANYTVRLFSRVSTIAASRTAPRRRTVAWAMVVAGLIAVFGTTGPGTARGGTPSFQGLGFLNPEFPFSIANGLSGDGTTVVGISSISADAGSGFRWTAATGMVAIPLARPEGVNYDGSIVVGECPGLGACFWSEATGIVGLPGGPNLSAREVSADGSVIVGGGNLFAEGEDARAALWRVEGAAMTLTKIGPYESRAYDVSADGRAVVGTSDTVDVDPDVQDAFRWSEETGLVFLDSLNGPWSGASAISADGSVVVGTRSWGGEGTEGFRWTENNGALVLTQSAGPSAVSGVSGDGTRIVGWAEFGIFVWTDESGIRVLSELLRDDYGLTETESWAIDVANTPFISNNGLVFAGTGQNPNGESEAWLAVIPEPSSVALGIIGALSIAGGYLAKRCRRGQAKQTDLLRRRRRLGGEFLERRDLLAIEDASFNCSTGHLFIDGDGGVDDIRISGSGAQSNLTYNEAAIPVNWRVNCAGAPTVSQLKSILIESGGGNDTIDMRGVTRANGFSLLDGSIELNGQTGNDTIYGSEFGDILRGHRGDDSLYGGPGDDFYIFEQQGNNELGTDQVFENANEGNDSFDFTEFEFAVTLDLGSTNAQIVARQNSQPTGQVWLTLTLNNTATFENILAPRDVPNGTHDTLTGNSLNNIIHGFSGNDVIHGLGGDDHLEGGDGNDTIYGGDGDDRINGGAGNDFICADTWNSGPQTCTGSGNDYANGNGFADRQNVGTLASPTGGELAEASGLVVSRNTHESTHVLWTIEDRGNPTWLYANLTNGASRGYYVVGDATDSNVENFDWEDMAFYAAPNGTGYLYVADIGDNDNDRESITIYRFAEPAAPASGSGFQGNIIDANIERVVLEYPNGDPRDSEAMMVDPRTGDIFIVSKQEPDGGTNGRAGLYRLSAENANWTAMTQTAGATRTLTYRGTVAFPANSREDSPSSADISPDGMEIVIKSDNAIYQYVRSGGQSIEDVVLLGAESYQGRPIQIVTPREANNRESIAFHPNFDSFFTVSEWTGGTPQARPVYQYERGTGTSNVVHGGGGVNIVTRGGASGTRSGESYDVNFDGVADMADVAALAGSYGRGYAAGWSAWLPGDFNDDGAVNVLDLILLRNNCDCEGGESLMGGGEGGGEEMMGGGSEESMSGGGGGGESLLSENPARIYITLSGSTAGGGELPEEVPSVQLDGPEDSVTLYVWANLGGYEFLNGYGLDIRATEEGVVKATASTLYNPDIVASNYGNAQIGVRWDGNLTQPTLNPDGIGEATLAAGAAVFTLTSGGGLNSAYDGSDFIGSLDELYDTTNGAFLVQSITLEALSGSGGLSTDIVLYIGEMAFSLDNLVETSYLTFGLGEDEVANNLVGESDGTAHAMITVAAQAPSALVMAAGVNRAAGSASVAAAISASAASSRSAVAMRRESRDAMLSLAEPRQIERDIAVFSVVRDMAQREPRRRLSSGRGHFTGTGDGVLASLAAHAGPVYAA